LPADFEAKVQAVLADEEKGETPPPEAPSETPSPEQPPKPADEGGPSHA
jgi:hypothetical protein